MKVTHLAALSLASMAAVFGSVFAITPEGGLAASKPDDRATAYDDDDDDGDRKTGASRAGDEPGASFKGGSTVRVEARLGHAAMIASSGTQETFMLVEVRGDPDAKGAPARGALSIVVDKSGSMSGTRHANALSAASTAVQRLRDGDQVSVVAFDTRPEVVVSNTVISPSTRQQILSSIQGIKLGGDTCISCGVEEGLNELRRATADGDGVVPRMLVLSDGDTNNGIRDIPGFKSLAQRAMNQGVSVSTIGVDLEYNEKIMTALAQGANGRHYFVENDRDLQGVFDAEATALTDTVASGVTAEIELDAGIELVRVFDRTFARSGSRISVPLGSLAKGETKTVLVQVRLPSGAASTLPVAHVNVGFRGADDDRASAVKGDLAVKLIDDGTKADALDALVFDRLQRSETAAALRDANTLFSQGKVDEARRRLETQQAALASARPQAAKAAPASRAADVDKSFDKQETEVQRSLDNFATPPAPSPAEPAPDRKGKSQVKRNAQTINEMAF